MCEGGEREGGVKGGRSGGREKGGGREEGRERGGRKRHAFGFECDDTRMHENVITNQSAPNKLCEFSGQCIPPSSSPHPSLCDVCELQIMVNHTVQLIAPKALRGGPPPPPPFPPFKVP